MTTRLLNWHVPIKMLASQISYLAVFDFRQRHYLLVFLWASLKSSKHFYKSLDFTINNHRPSASEQPGIIKARSQTFRVLFKTELAFHCMAVCVTCKWDENQQLSNLPACEKTECIYVPVSPVKPQYNGLQMVLVHLGLITLLVHAVKYHVLLHPMQITWVRSPKTNKNLGKKFRSNNSIQYISL